MIGKTVSHYTIVGRLGHGGMGIVYKAVDNRLKRTVALKFLPPGLADSEESRERLLREARMASTLEHQNICAIHEVDETPDGQVFICMSFYEGRTLSQLEKDGPLPVAEALRIALQVTEGLAHAHSQGVIHRDIKPANIMLTPSGVTKVMDFGLARQEGQERLTRTGTTVGTLAYMAPEQVTGDPVDSRSDVWSVGVLLFEMLTGRLPFAGDYEAAVAYSIVHEAPRSVKELNPGVPDVLDAVIRRCLARKPGDRFATAADLLTALRQVWQSLSPPGAVPVPLTAPLRRTPRVSMRSWIFWTIGIVVVAAGLLAVPIWTRNSQGSPPLPPLPTLRKVAILPFDASPDDTASRALAGGFRITLLDALAMAEGAATPIWTVSAEQMEAGNVLTRQDALQQDAVNLVLNGELKSQGTGVVLILSVHDARTGQVLRKQELRGPITNLSTFQEGLIASATEMLELQLSNTERSRMMDGGTALPGAYKQFIQGSGMLSWSREAGSADTAASLVRGAATYDPSYAAAWEGVARACLKQSKSDEKGRNRLLLEAEAAARQSLKIADRPSTRLTLAKILEEMNKPVEAVRECRAALQNFPSFFDAQNELAWVYWDSNNLIEAERQFKACTRLRPDYWLGYNQLGYFYIRIGRFPEAAEILQKAGRLVPENVTIYSNLISAYFNLGRVKETLEAIEQASHLKPTAVMLANWGTIMFFNRDYLEAAGMLERAIQTGPSPFLDVIWGNLAECYRQLPGQETKARSAFDKAIELTERKLVDKPGDAVALSRLALYLAMTGQSTRALQAIAAARQRKPVPIDVLERAVRVLELTGKREESLRTLREYVDNAGTPKVFVDDPDLSDLRQDPRYVRLAAEAGMRPTDTRREPS